jgi:hypothetical protein
MQYEFEGGSSGSEVGGGGVVGLDVLLALSLPPKSHCPPLPSTARCTAWPLPDDDTPAPVPAPRRARSRTPLTLRPSTPRGPTTASRQRSSSSTVGATLLLVQPHCSAEPLAARWWCTMHTAMVRTPASRAAG